MRISQKPALIFLFLFSHWLGFAQLVVDTNYTAEQLVDQILVGNGMRVGNIVLKGHRIGLGHFQSDSAVIGMNEGLLLATGSVFDAEDLNETPGQSGVLYSYGTATKERKPRRGDRDLNRLAKGRTYDVNIIEFDFVPFHNRITFNYSFGSEEFEEYVGSKYNDVFGFFLSGPGVRKTNIALLTGTDIPIAINNVNQRKYPEYYISNDYFINYGLLKGIPEKPHLNFWQWIRINLLGGKSKTEEQPYYIDEGRKEKLNQVLVDGFEYDGFTTKMQCTWLVEPFQKYHLKIAVGDVGDAIFDSGVFIEAGSFSSFKDTMPEDFVDYPDLSQILNFDSIFGIFPDTELIENPSPFQLTTIYFDSDEYRLVDTAKSYLTQLAEYLKKETDWKAEIWGYTDADGGVNHNQKLSEKRAKSVQRFLVDQGIHFSRMTYRGLNYTHAVGDNATQKGKAQNRRVEIILYKNE
ncbi:OmpA family protein [bacterium SCSIO 12741]|nr:OmpA family protein [bacterium SCSIO 12741]